MIKHVVTFVIIILIIAFIRINVDSMLHSDAN